MHVNPAPDIDNALRAGHGSGEYDEVELDDNEILLPDCSSTISSAVSAPVGEDELLDMETYLPVSGDQGDHCTGPHLNLRETKEILENMTQMKDRNVGLSTRKQLYSENCTAP